MLYPPPLEVLAALGWGGFQGSPFHRGPGGYSFSRKTYVDPTEIVRNQGERRGKGENMGVQPPQAQHLLVCQSSMKFHSPSELQWKFPLGKVLAFTWPQ